MTDRCARCGGELHWPRVCRGTSTSGHPYCCEDCAKRGLHAPALARVLPIDDPMQRLTDRLFRR